jgi:hypothetical protein
MSDYTYEPPDGNKFLNALRKVFEAEGKQDILDILNHCESIEITTDGQYSRRRWNEYNAFASFRTDFETIGKIEDYAKLAIHEKCNSIMPAKCGLCVSEIEFAPSLELLAKEDESAESIIAEIGELKNANPGILNYLLDEELIEKGRVQSEIYHLLFVVENSLRRFIDLVLQGALGKQYFEKINLNKEIITNIRSRKQDEAKNKWLRVRGDSEIYYLDFIDLSFAILNNWQYFKQYFPDQAWIKVKIDELYKCRCLIAHNSDIGGHEIDVIRTNYKSILLQLSKSYSSDEAPF